MNDYRYYENWFNYPYVKHGAYNYSIDYDYLFKDEMIEYTSTKSNQSQEKEKDYK